MLLLKQTNTNIYKIYTINEKTKNNSLKVKKEKNNKNIIKTNELWNDETRPYHTKTSHKQ